MKLHAMRRMRNLRLNPRCAKIVYNTCRWGAWAFSTRRQRDVPVPYARWGEGFGVSMLFSLKKLGDLHCLRLLCKHVTNVIWYDSSSSNICEKISGLVRHLARIFILEWYSSIHFPVAVAGVLWRKIPWLRTGFGAGNVFLPLFQTRNGFLNGPK